MPAIPTAIIHLTRLLPVSGLIVGLIAVVAVGLCGCQSGRAIAEENDRLRRVVLDFEDEVARLSGRISELESALETSAELRGADPVIESVTPRVVAIEIDRLSHIAQREDAASALIFVKPRDARSRMIQLVGSLSAQIVWIPLEGEAATLAGTTFDPETVRDAYRSSFMGTHYSFELPLDASTLARVREHDGLIVRVSFTDGLTGRVHAAERTVSLD